MGTQQGGGGVAGGWGHSKGVGTQQGGGGVAGGWGHSKGVETGQDMARGWDNFPFLHVFSPSAVSVPGDTDLLCDLVS